MSLMRKYDFADSVQLLEKTKEHNLTIGQLMLEREAEIFGKKQEEILAALLHSYQIMKKSTQRPLEKKLKTMGGLIGGEAILMMKAQSPISGKFFSKSNRLLDGGARTKFVDGIDCCCTDGGLVGCDPWGFCCATGGAWIFG